MYFPAARHLVFSDIPNNRMLRYDECDGSVSVFRQPSDYANGNTVDRQGRLVTCEHGGRRVVRTEHDGRLTVIADNYKGKRLNSPNDVVVGSDGTIWFTDPPYGILSDYEGHKGGQRAWKELLFRVDGASGEIRVVVDDFVRPNGLALSADERQLFIVDSAGRCAPEAHSRVRCRRRRFAVRRQGVCRLRIRAFRRDAVRQYGPGVGGDRRRNTPHRAGRSVDLEDPDPRDARTSCLAGQSATTSTFARRHPSMGYGCTRTG